MPPYILYGVKYIGLVSPPPPPPSPTKKTKKNRSAALAEVAQQARDELPHVHGLLTVAVPKQLWPYIVMALYSYRHI